MHVGQNTYILRLRVLICKTGIFKTPQSQNNVWKYFVALLKYKLFTYISSSLQINLYSQVRKKKIGWAQSYVLHVGRNAKLYFSTSIHVVLVDTSKYILFAPGSPPLSCTNLLAILWICQAHSYLRAFALLFTQQNMFFLQIVAWMSCLYFLQVSAQILPQDAFPKYFS